MLKRRTIQFTGFLVIFFLVFTLLTALESFGGVRSARAITWSGAIPNGEYVPARIAVRPSDGVAFVIGSQSRLGSAFWYIGTDGNAVAPQRFLTDTDLTVRDAVFDRDNNLHLIFSKGTVQDTAYCRVPAPQGLGEFQIACSAPTSLGRGNLSQMSLAVPSGATTPDVSYLATIGADGLHILDSTNRGTGWTHSYTLTGCSAQPFIRLDSVGNSLLVCRENAGSGNIVSYYKAAGATSWGTPVPAGTCQVTNNTCAMDLALRPNGVAVLPHLNAGTAYSSLWNGSSWQSSPGNPFGGGAAVDTILNLSAFPQPDGFGVVWATQGSDRAWYSTSLTGSSWSTDEQVWYILGNTKSAIGGATSGRVYVIGQFEDSISNGSVYYASGVGAFDPPTPTPVPPTATNTLVPPTITNTITASTPTPNGGTPTVTVALSPTSGLTPTPTSGLPFATPTTGTSPTATTVPATPSPASTAIATHTPAVTATSTPTTRATLPPTPNAGATSTVGSSNQAATATVLANNGRATATALAYDATRTAQAGSLNQLTATANAQNMTATAQSNGVGATATAQAVANIQQATVQAQNNSAQATAQAVANNRNATVVASERNATATVQAQVNAANTNRNAGSNPPTNNNPVSNTNTGTGIIPQPPANNLSVATVVPTRAAAIALLIPTATPKPIDEVPPVEEEATVQPPSDAVPAYTGNSDFAVLTIMDNPPDTLWLRLLISLLISGLVMLVIVKLKPKRFKTVSVSDLAYRRRK